MRIALERFKDKFEKFGIGDSDELIKSLAMDMVSGSGGDFQKIQFFFLYYGTFVDMGVGKGVKIGDVKEASMSRRLEGRRSGNRRRPKKWYSKTMHGEVNALADILREQYGTKGILQIIENIPTKVQMTL